MSPARGSGAVLVVLRHAPAQHRDPRAWPNDDDRPLRPGARPEFRRAVRGLDGLLRARGVVATSPLTRARETTEMLGASYRPARTPQVWTELRPEVPASEVLGRIAQTVPRTGGPLIIVGHEPQFSRLVGLAITGEAVPLIRCSKGGAVAVQFDARVVPGGGQILWALTRGQLGRLAGGKGRPERDDAE